MELVISISRVTRFVRVGGNALGVKLPTDISSKSTPNQQTVQSTQVSRVARIRKRISRDQAVKLATVVKQRPRMMSHLSLSLAIVLVVVIGGLNATESNLTAQDSQAVGPLSALSSQTGYGGVVDQTASAYIAAGVAQEVGMPLAEQVIKDAQALTTKTAYASVSDSVLSKPQVISTAGRLARGVTKYTVKDGDTVESIAAQFNISADTVRWANNINQSSQPTPGQVVSILPVSGVLHTVSDTDTPEGLALIYQTSADLIVRFNDAEIEGLKPGTTIVVPNGVITPSPQTPTPSFVSGSGSYIVNSAFTPSYAGNGYDYGWCTWGAANKRAAAGRPIPSNWGNAIGWRYNAAASGYATGSAPQAGAIAYYNQLGGWGHVGYVEAVYPDGSAKFTDMNYPIWGRYTERIVPASEMGGYTFIY